MLKGLRFGQFAYDWLVTNILHFDAEIEALNQNGINLLGAVKLTNSATEKWKCRLSFGVKTGAEWAVG